MLASGTRFQNLAVAFCLLFGIILIAQVQVAGDGMWFWYAVALNHGSHLYRDLHLPLQPLYPLIVAGSLRLFGTGWMVGKITPVVLMAIYLLSIRMVVRYFPGTDLQRAVTLCFGFSAPLLFGASRFDDYHVLTDSCASFSAVLLLAILQPASQAASGGEIDHQRGKTLLLRAAALGLCSGLGMVSRLNDGAFLALTVFVALAAATPTRRLPALAVFIAVATATVVGTVALTGDTLQQWAGESIFHAASAKGGAGHVLLSPIWLLSDAVTYWFKNPAYGLAQICLGSVCFAAVTLRYRRSARFSKRTLYAVLALSSVSLLFTIKRWSVANLPNSVNALAVPAAYVFSAIALYRLVRSFSGVRTQGAARALLVLLPMGQLLSGSMSSGGFYLPLTSSLGMFLLLLPIAFPGILPTMERQTAYATAMALLAVCSLTFKVQHPFAWHNYNSAPLFTHRQWYKHPKYGPMVIESDLLQLTLPMCKVATSQPGQELLALPFPYPNYFCGIAPWRGYVQTFFDISTRETIGRLNGDLQLRPPGTIAYQRQMNILKMHEHIYAHDQRLPQRDLDEFIGAKLASGAWTLRRKQCLGRNDWLTIETHPTDGPTGETFASMRSECN